MRILEELERTSNEALKYFELPESEMSKNYGPEKWNIKQILVHLADAEAVLLERIKRTISEENPTVIGFDQDLWEEKLSYNTLPLELSKEIFVANRKSISFLAKEFYQKEGNRINTHNIVGVKTLKDEFDKVIWHSEGHLDQIKIALKS
ncbi:DinB superfamily protein [Spirosomataceae bacterium TFI 002]|nr:DinB superfamily protein [Spirosomataceae bacterium TFI 002]